MTYPEHYLLAYGGTLLNGQEIWSNSIRFWQPNENVNSWAVDAAEALTHAEAHIRTLFADTRSLMTTTTKCTWVKFNKINELGKYASDNESNTLWLDATPIAGTRTPGAGGPFPPQLSLAVSWLTDRQRGPASKGRIFIPNPNVGLDANSRISETIRTQTVAVYGTFLKNLGNWPGIDLTELAPAVVSNVGAGAAEHITRVSVGDVMDTQRRRRNAMDEVRTTYALSEL